MQAYIGICATVKPRNVDIRNLKIHLKSVTENIKEKNDETHL